MEQREATMPHVIVKLWPGQSEAQKSQLAGRIVRDVTDVLGYGEESVSVAMEEVDARDWAEKVFKPDIASKPDHLYKKPGYELADLL
jgi:4-oxalocrotonate tautomerase